MVNNKRFQLLVIKSEISLDDNCYEKGSPERFTAEFFVGDRSQALTEYQKARQKDLRSKEGDCGLMPKKIDVRKLHEETMTYTERARKILREKKKESG